jgi:hypothetical protein
MLDGKAKSERVNKARIRLKRAHKAAESAAMAYGGWKAGQRALGSSERELDSRLRETAAEWYLAEIEMEAALEAK